MLERLPLQWITVRHVQALIPSYIKIKKKHFLSPVCFILVQFDHFRIRPMNDIANVHWLVAVVSYCHTQTFLSPNSSRGRRMSGVMMKASTSAVITTSWSPMTGWRCGAITRVTCTQDVSPIQPTLSLFLLLSGYLGGMQTEYILPERRAHSLDP